jgi:hypothetical protein
VAHRLLHHALDADAIAEAHLELGRMDVHIHLLGRDLDVQQQRRAVAGVDGGAVAGLRGPHQERVLERAAIDEELGAAPGGLRIAGALDESGDPERSGGVAHRHQRACELRAPYRRQPILQRLPRRHHEPAASVDVKLEAGLGVRERERGQHLVRSASLARDRAEELPASRRIEEDGADGDGGPLLPDTVGHPVEPAAGDAELGRGALAFGGGQGEAGDRGDGGKGLAPEAEGADPDEVRRAPQLAGGVAVEREHRVLPSHAGPVVAHQHQGLAALLQLHPHVPGAGIQGVLHQLLHHRGGTLDDLARGDLIGHGVREYGDASGHRENLAADGGHRPVCEPSTLGARRLHHDPAR